MPEWLEVFILAVIEGVTEFLPISSTGHMLLVENWLRHVQPQAFFAIVQSGAVLAVLMVFTGRVKEMLTRWREKETQQYVAKLAVAFLLTAIGGLLLKKAGFKLPKNPVPIALATLIGGILILIIEQAIRGKQLRDTVTWPVAIAIGIGQLLAVIFPGLSRSGSTILMALAMGVARPKAAEFSFLLGIPTLLAAGAMKTVSELRGSEENVNWGLVLLGSTVAAITAF